jgi:hypothetical protein
MQGVDIEMRRHDRKPITVTFHCLYIHTNQGKRVPIQYVGKKGINGIPNATGKWLTLRLHFWEVRDLNLSPETGYP